MLPCSQFANDKRNVSAVVPLPCHTVSWISTRIAKSIGTTPWAFLVCRFTTIAAGPVALSSQRRSIVSPTRISGRISTTKSTLLSIRTIRWRSPQGNAALVNRLFPTIKPGRMLDYGGGNGVLAESLLATGFPHVETYDPFVERYATRPAERFDCVICFEVVEHSTDPAHIFADLDAFLNDRGMILFSTLVQPADIDQQGLNWWYAGPRNAHVSLYTRESLAQVVQPLGFKLGSFSESYHVLFREIPDFARHLIRL